jgi:hypothetical protein
MSLCGRSGYGSRRIGSSLVGGLLVGATFAITAAPVAGPSTVHKISANVHKIGARAQDAADPDVEPRVPTDLIDKAREQGAVRVIVQLRVPENAAQPVIEAVKQAVRTEISTTPHRVVRELQGLPLLAIEASADTLRVLRVSPHVLRVQEDTIARPQR